jgi:hypothetical protein
LVTVPVTARSPTWIWGLSPAEIVGSNPIGGMDVCLLWVLCDVKWRSLRPANHSSIGVLPAVVRRCMRSRNSVNEEDLAHWGLLHKKQQRNVYVKRNVYASSCWLENIASFRQANRYV